MGDQSHNLYLVEEPEPSGDGADESEETMNEEAREGTTTEDRPTSEAFGLWLRRQRELRQIGLQEIGDRTKISVRYLKAMEEDRFELLPGAVFARGFLREYARYVGLNPDEVVNFYLATREEEQEDSEAELDAREERRSSPWPIVWGVLALVLLVLLGVWLARALGGGSETSTSSESPTAPPAASSPAPSPVAAEPSPRRDRPTAAESPPAMAAEETQGTEEVTAPLRVTLDFGEDCWLEARIDGRRLLAKQFTQGESIQLAARERIELLTLGNAGGVSLHVNGIPYPVDAASGEVLRNVTFDLETARRLEERGR